MKKIIIYSLLWTVVLLLVSAYRNLSFNPLVWGWGTRSFVFYAWISGTLVIASFANESIKRISHWSVFAAGFLTSLFIIFEILYPAIIK